MDKLRQMLLFLHKVEKTYSLKISKIKIIIIKKYMDFHEKIKQNQVITCTRDLKIIMK